MKWLLACLLVVVSTALAQDDPDLKPNDPAKDNMRDTGYVAGYVLAAPHPNGRGQFKKAVKDAGGGDMKEIGKLDVYLIKVPPGQEKKIVAKLKKHPSVKFSELDRTLQPNAYPNDTYYYLQWHLPKIGAPAAWAINSGGGVVVALLDSGVQSTHPDLTGQLVPGWNFVENNSTTEDVLGHGTSTAGTIVALTNNARGVASIAFGAKIMPLKICDAAGTTSWSKIGNAISYAADHNVRVVSWSWSGASVYGSTILTAAKYLRDHNGVMFVSSGNTGAVDNTPPTSLMITVAATDKNDARATFSTWGAFVDIAAPGTSIPTTAWHSGYCMCSGTSFATPLVAGTAAMMIAVKPSITPAQIESILYSTAVDLGAPGKDVYFGNGRLNSSAAVAAAQALP